MNVEVPYGDSTLFVAVEGADAEVVRSGDIPEADEDSVLNRALDEPLGAPDLEGFLSGAGSVLIVVNDAARPTPTAAMLRHLLPRFGSVPARILVATGAHRAPTPDELDRILGPSVDRNRVSVAVHDARDEAVCEYVGRTRLGTDVALNRAALEADRLVLLSSVEPHYFAGFTGGRKSIVPGLAALATIERNHSHALSPGSAPLALDGNPVHEDMDDALGLLDERRIFSYQTVLDRNGRVAFSASGSVRDSFAAALPRAVGIHSVEVEPADVVVAVADRPLDRDLYQAQKAVEHGRLALRDGGTLILVSPCSDGLGPSDYLRHMRGAGSPAEMLERLSSDYRLGDHKAAKYAEFMSRSGLWAVTSLDPALLSDILVRPFDSLQSAVDEAVAGALERRPRPPEHGAPVAGDPVRVVFLMTASTTVPRAPVTSS